MWSNITKYSLMMIFFACAFSVSSVSVSTDAVASALNSDEEKGNIPGIRDGYKGIRSYDNNFPYNNTNHSMELHSTPRKRSSDRDRSINDGSHDNKNNNDCTKCKWENDDYWEQDEPEREYDENECDDGDNGQYRPNKMHYHVGNKFDRGHIESHPSGVYKTRPINDGEIDERIKGNKPDNPFGIANFPMNTESSSFVTTPKLGSGWNTSPIDTSKPGYSGVTGAFGTTSSFESGWDSRITPNSFSSTPRYSWSNAYDDKSSGSFENRPKPIWNNKFDISSTVGFSSQKSGPSWNTHHNIPAGFNYEITTKPGINWNIKPDTSTDEFLSSQKSGTFWNTRPDSMLTENFRTTPKFEQERNTRFDSTSTARFPLSQKSVSDWMANHVNIPTGSFGITPKPETTSNTRFSNTGRFLSSQKPASWNNGYEYDMSTGIFGTTPKSEQSLNTEFSDKSKSSWNQGHETTSVRTPCIRPESSCKQGLQGPVKVGATPVNINLAKSGESISGIFPGTLYKENGVFPTYSHSKSNENLNKPYGQSGMQDSFRPTYETTRGTQFNIGTAAWPGKELRGGNIPWSDKPRNETVFRHPENKNGEQPFEQPNGANRTWPNNLYISETWPSNKPLSEKEIWPERQSGDDNESRLEQIGHGNTPRCSSRKCTNSNGSFGRNGNCNRNYNCGNDCSDEGKSPTIHGPCIKDEPNGVTKTYYPVGIDNGCRSGDNSCNQVGGTSITPEDPRKWNSANPFLYGTGGNTLSDISRSWNSETTTKPIGKGNPFLDFTWNSNLEYDDSNTHNKNISSAGKENTNFFNKENPFLVDNKKKEDIEVNPTKSVISYEGRRYQGSNHFLKPSGSDIDSLNNPLRYPDRFFGNDCYAIKDDSYPERILSQHGNNDRFYPVKENTQDTSPLGCKLGLFGCGTPGSGSYVATKDHSSDGISRGIIGNTGLDSGSPKGLGNDLGQVNSETSSGGVQNQGGSNSWASSNAFASSSSGSWSGNPVKS